MLVRGWVLHGRCMYPYLQASVAFLWSHVCLIRALIAVQDPQNDQVVISCSSEGAQEAVSFSAPLIGTLPSASCQQQSPPDAALQHAPEEPLKTSNGASAQHVVFADTLNLGSLHDEELGSRTATSSMTNASGPQSRRQSLLGDAGRASRRSSGFRDSLTDSLVPPVLQASCFGS